MKKAKILTLLSLCMLALSIQACSSNNESEKMNTEAALVNTNTEEASKDTPAQTINESNDKPESSDSNSSEANKENTQTNKETADSKIDTSVFAYAESVDVNDARDINKHINLVVHMSDELKQGLATEHVIIQTYDFLQQSDIQGADTITIGVMVGAFRVSQITVDTKKFDAGENFIDSVLAASKIDKMTDDVKEYGKVMERW
ncbi:hypothetical protein [Paenibacillus sacheonensis]|uniref:Lipoprotein n=1 Tax=Paenibacillus sacheonensis TaxID=742054 RepID=A0A7X4YTB4_9BACL|nr:hypothetical protein [Paenibacillus sacheonensis]MBM7565758.1 uncharacterized protein YcfL [Paenibacillus sacheonensis]NBC72185.1 hypothetical protein [Paenibacillus sacheonensis]